VSKKTGGWEQQLKAAGLSARRDEDWRKYPRVSLDAMKFHGLTVAHYDHYSWEREEDPTCPISLTSLVPMAGLPHQFGIVIMAV
jgi:hypothetical protein